MIKYTYFWQWVMVGVFSKCLWKEVLYILAKVDLPIYFESFAFYIWI